MSQSHDPAAGDRPTGEYGVPPYQPERAPGGGGYSQPGYGQPGYGQPGSGYGQPGTGQAGQPAYGAGGWQQGAPYQQPYGYNPENDPYAKSRLAAGLLGILLGGFGVHRFYLGYVGIGIAQIIVTLVTFGFGWIWGLIEGILYLTSRTGTFSVDASGRPLRW